MMNRQSGSQQDYNVYEQIAKRSIEAKDAAFFSGFVLGLLVAIVFTVIWFVFVVG